MKLADAAVRLQPWLPKALLSACVYRIARSRTGWLKNALIRWFSRRFRVDLGEAARGRAEEYASFNDFFTRELKAGARPLAGGEESVVSPVDGVLSQFGALEHGQLLQAKGVPYALEELLADRDACAAFVNGRYATLYLAPQHYHRVHMPVTAQLVRTRYVPGERFSVNAATARLIPRVFCRNERVVCHFDGEGGPLALVLVGALNVSSISTVTRGEIISGPPREWIETAPVPLVRGTELGRFNLGSTVVVLFAEGAVAWDASLAPGDPVRMGQALGTRAGERARAAP
jgi:phosphatidylserine decarboxylase